MSSASTACRISSLSYTRDWSSRGPSRRTTSSLSLKKDRSTVYRALQRLVTSGLAFRDTKTIERGGYYHVYTAVPPAQLKERLRRCADDWFENMRGAIDDFDLPCDSS